MGTSGNTPALPLQTVHLAGPEGTRLHFSGPLTAVKGSIPLINEGTEKQKIRSIGVNSDKLLGAARLPLREIPFSGLLFRQRNVKYLFVWFAEKGLSILSFDCNRDE